MVEERQVGGARSKRLAGQDLIAPSLLCLAMAVTVGSQVWGFFAPLTVAAWLSVLAVGSAGAFRGLRMRGFFVGFCVCVIADSAVFSLCAWVTANPAYLTGFYTLLVKVVLIYAAGYFLAGLRMPSSMIRDVLWFYISVSALFALWIWITYFAKFSNWMSTEVYIFGSKNSAGQILGAALIASIAMIQNGKKSSNIVLILFACLFAFIITISQCRTAILGVVFALIFLSFKTGNKRFILYILPMFVISLYAFPQLREFISHALLFDKYSGTDLDTFSSGRLTLWSVAISSFTQHFLIGTGDYYVDNFYIMALARLGVIGALPIFVLWACRVYVNLRTNFTYAARSGNETLLRICRIIGALSVFYLVESALEGYPPFGPGACCFLFWILCGYYDALRLNGIVLAETQPSVAKVLPVDKHMR